MSAAKPPILIAVDRPDVAGALALVDRLDPALCRLKIGLELFTAAGPAAVEALQGRGFEVFLDLKFHDIPNTVAGACRSAAALGVWMINVHAGGGPRMLAAAAEAVASARRRPILVGVTVLTSMDQAELAAVGVAADPAAQVLRLARCCADAGLDGVVCSPLEIAPLRAALGRGFTLVTPGIRGPGDAQGDQRRTLAPAAALAAGADYLVIGRPITAAADPAAALQSILASLPAPAPC
ncbi:orotidine-5'-phosphate decarboxylase [Immundisolibacter sp.]|uniref:orotidine-5'-phosphate decarboxylase n=1 Tax=Immundisolibacter sp. TaxID=1934948 RepID=UPI0026263109|nr:orotidine-5'-phosphate decarboxylase [Immundisolibacter sp.]MDD3650591.1 orotidine-5'-phosphate decarboxylase [Immundisolibacter sp.]